MAAAASSRDKTFEVALESGERPQTQGIQCKKKCKKEEKSFNGNAELALTSWKTAGVLAIQMIFGDDIFFISIIS